MSTLAGGEAEDIPDEEKTVFDWCKEGSVAKLESVVSKECINTKDSQVDEDDRKGVRGTNKPRLSGRGRKREREGRE